MTVAVEGMVEEVVDTTVEAVVVVEAMVERREYGYNGGGWWRWLPNLHPQNLEHKTPSTRSSSTKP
uniref:Uncharacterized protein n=1 Tax=Brassica campestris TaxID=3711 RepID=A0A3P5YFB9_BRACM|nr:unnamed protein product [Brassica rapa]